VRQESERRPGSWRSDGGSKLRRQKENKTKYGKRATLVALYTTRWK